MSKQARRQNLIKEDPHCFYCGREVVERELAPGEAPADDTATVEHIPSLVRGPFAGPRRTVLACHRCNNDHAHAEQSALAKAIKRRRKRAKKRERRQAQIAERDERWAVLRESREGDSR